MPTAVTDRSTLTLAKFKSLLQISDDSGDAFITLSLAGAKEVCDLFVNNAFQDSDGNDLAIPSSIDMGLIKWVLRDMMKKKPGLIRQRRDRIEQEWDVNSRTGDEEIREPYWRPHRLIPGLSASYNG